MTRSELVHRLFLRFPDISEDHMERIVALIFEEITTSLAKKNRSEFRNFGAFSVRHRKGRVGRNPRTGEIVKVAEKDIPFFKCGRSLLTSLNQWKS